MAYYNKKPVVSCHEKDTRHLLFCGSTWHTARSADRKHAGSDCSDRTVIVIGIQSVFLWMLTGSRSIRPEGKKTCRILCRIAKELLLEEVHRLQEERSAFEKERDKTMEKLKEQESFFDKKFKILEMGFAKLDEDRKSFEAKKRAFEYSRQFYQEKQEKEPFSELAEEEDMLFFRGVTHPLALKKRYKDLIKIYHPDNSCGDKWILQQINTEYDRLKNVITYQRKA